MPFDESAYAAAKSAWQAAQRTKQEHEKAEREAKRKAKEAELQAEKIEQARELLKQHGYEHATGQELDKLRKEHDELHTAAAQLLEQRDAAQARVDGQGKERASLEARIRELEEATKKPEAPEAKPEPAQGNGKTGKAAGYVFDRGKWNRG